MIACPTNCGYRTQHPKHMASHIAAYGHNPNRRRKEFRGHHKVSGKKKK